MGNHFDNEVFLFPWLLMLCLVPMAIAQSPQQAGDMHAWSLVRQGQAQGSMQWDTSNPLDDRHPDSLKLTVTNVGDRCGIANNGMPPMNVKQGQWYDATFFARIEPNHRGIGLVFSLETADGKTICARTTLPEVGTNGIGQPVVENPQWCKYTVSLHAYSNNPNCRLVIWPIEPGTLWLDSISLASRKMP